MLSNTLKKVKKTNENINENIICDVFAIYPLFVIIMRFLNGTDLIKAINSCLIQKLVQDNRKMSYLYYVNKQINRERILSKQGCFNPISNLIRDHLRFKIRYVERCLKEYIFMYKYCTHFKMYERFNTVKELVNQTLELKAFNKIRKVRIIIHSIAYLSIEAIDCLLKHNVDINFIDELNYTPLHYLAIRLDIMIKTKIQRYENKQILLDKFCVYDIFKTFLERMSIHSINCKSKKKGYTVLDILYTIRINERLGLPDKYSRSRINYNLFIKLLRNKGGRSNYYDINGVNVGRGEGDLNTNEINKKL